MKTCTGCRETKPLAEFGRDKQKSDGLTVRCKACRRTEYRQYAQTEAGKVSQRRRGRRYAERHPEKRAALTQAWREKHPGYSAEANRKWREANPDGAARYYQANRERIRELGREWRARNRDKARDIDQRRRARKLAATIGPVDAEALWIECRGLCGICFDPIDASLRFPERMSASLDHIVPLSKGGHHSQDNLQWAHLVCNISKGAKVPNRP